MPTKVTGGDVPQQNRNQIEHRVIPRDEHDALINNLNPIEPEVDHVPVVGGDVPQYNQNIPMGGIAVPTIVDQATPIVVFAGPPTSGKSMILVRLAKYLHNNGYIIQPDPTFLNTEQYRRDCAEFSHKLHTQIALDGSVTFLLVDVFKNGRLIAKLLEAPGEDFYTTDPQKIASGKNNKLEPYLTTILASPNPKAYVVMLDLDSDISFRTNGYHRESYVQRFQDFFYPKIDIKRDRIVLLYNKIDLTMYGNINRCTDPKGAMEDAKKYYGAWFSSMRRSTLLGIVDNFVFKTFCTGLFSDWLYDSQGNKYKTYNTGNDIYPAELWKEITRRW